MVLEVLQALACGLAESPGSIPELEENEVVSRADHAPDVLLGPEWWLHEDWSIPRDCCSCRVHDIGCNGSWSCNIGSSPVVRPELWLGQPCHGGCSPRA